MSPTLAMLFGLSVASDVGGQLCFKRGANASHGRDEAASHVGYWLATLGNGWLWAGVAVYVVEIIAWLQILARAPLSVAMPIASLNYCGILLASRLFLREPVGRRRWLGALLITAGVLIVGTGA